MESRCSGENQVSVVTIEGPLLLKERVYEPNPAACRRHDCLGAQYTSVPYHD